MVAHPPVPPVVSSRTTGLLGAVPCSVIESSSNSKKPCQFPFKFKGRTFYECTTITGTDDNDEYEYGNPWCSTKTDDNGNHISGQGVYGDCIDESCPITRGEARPLKESE